jgi:hypothetical protein
LRTFEVCMNQLLQSTVTMLTTSIGLASFFAIG